VAGSSAGAHLAVTAALTAGDPTFQPGFEEADTTVAAAIGLYGYYGPVDTARQPLPSSPADYVHPDAPPVLIAHGDQDTYVSAEHARGFADRLGGVSASPTVYVELPGGQHSFDLFHSIRFETLLDGIEAFAAWVQVRAADEDERSPARTRAA
jgi:acetyl esterase/lipase